MGEVSFEHLLGWETTVSASYLYSKGSHLPTFVDENLPQPTATVDLVVDGTSRGTFPFFRGARPDTRRHARRSRSTTASNRPITRWCCR